MVGSQIWEIYIILKGRGIEGCTLSQRPTAKGRKSSRLSWQTALEFAPKAITFHLGWPGLPGKSRLFDGLAHGSHPSLHALEGVLTHIQTCPPLPPLHVDQIRWLVGDCEGLQIHPASWEPFTKCHAERLAGICILSPQGKSNYDWQIRKLGRLIFCMLWQFMESKGFSLPARL